MTIAATPRTPEEVQALDARDTELHIAFLHMLLADDALQAEIPAGATLMLLPADDPELAAYNRERGVAAAAHGHNVYFRHVHRAPADAGAPAE
ncbi:MAG: hypothetical protein M3Q65_22055 [Chloroflexota bacterium]|nr:hypothetical protein [Chloroflexota bacterium]